MNGVEETFLLTNVESILPQGWEEFGTINAAGATGDLAVLSGRAGTTETAVLGVGGGTLIRDSEVLVTMAEFETSAFYGQEEDSGQLTGTAAADFYITAGPYAYITNLFSSSGAETDSFHLISGVSNVYGYANDAADQAWHYDAGGNDTYVASGTAYSYMSSGGPIGTGFFNVAVGFDVNYGFAVNGGFDVAYFFDSAGNDTFVSEPTQAYMSGPGFFSAAIGFEIQNGQSFVGGSLDFDVAFNRAPRKTQLSGFNQVIT
jgi:hypothetical protein